MCAWQKFPICTARAVHLWAVMTISMYLYRWHDVLPPQGLKPDKVTYNTVVDAYVRSGLLERASECLTAAGAAGIVLDAWSWSALMKGHVRQGDLRVRKGLSCEA